MEYTKKIIVIGSARSGTGYIARFMQKAGLDFGHEVEKLNGQSNHYMTFEDLETYDYVLHQIRHPLHVISSLQTMHESFWVQMKSYIPNIDISNKILRAMQYYAYVNKVARRKSILTYKIEEIEYAKYNISPFIDYDIYQTEEKNTRINTRPHEDLTWDDLKETNSLLFNSIYAFAERWKYA